MGNLTYDEKTPLGKAISDLGLTMRRAAELCDLHYKTMEGYCKRGRTGARLPSRAVLLHICQTLSLDPSQFSYGRDQPNGFYVPTAQLLNLHDA